MKNKILSQTGSMTALLAAGLLLLAVAIVVGYKFFAQRGLIHMIGDDAVRPVTLQATPVTTPAASPVSNSTDIKTMNKELNDTTVAPVDQDFKDLNSQASSL